MLQLAPLLQLVYHEFSLMTELTIFFKHLPSITKISEFITWDILDTLL